MADKALLCGINEYRSVNGLRGCVNDVESMKKLLTEVLGFDPKNVKTLTDQRVVKDEVQKQMKWLFRDVGAGDRVIFHFSGHGSQTADLDGDEDDGADELICLWDMDFNDPESYLLDDELRRWTQTLPKGVQLTVVLDNCHSGSGTRLVMAPVTGRPHQVVPMRIDDAATIKRSLSQRDQTGARGVDMAETAAAALDPRNDDVVRVRYIDPPPAIKEQIARRRKKTARGLVVANMNHILLAGCRADQTAADATIDGEPGGAFTYHLCKTFRDAGPAIDRKDLIDRVERSLRDGHFEQVPQLEGPTDSGPLFGNGSSSGPAAAPTAAATSKSGVPTSAPGGVSAIAELLNNVLKKGDQQTFNRVLSVLEGSPRGAAATATAARDVTGRHLLYVHGICKHSPGFSNGWWDALHPFTNEFGAGDLDGARHEVVWSDIVNERALQRDLLKRGVADRGVINRDALERIELAAQIRGALEERIHGRAAMAVPSVVSPDLSRAPLARGLTADRGLLSIPGLNCIDDFTVYMTDDAKRAEIIGRFTQAWANLGGASEVDVISHSWGTVVAYEALRELDDKGAAAPKVRNFITVGAALSIGPVKGRLRPANRDGRKPAMVHRWVNLNANGDPVGGRLQGHPYQVDAEFLDLPNLGCGWFDFGCAHGSYFKPENVQVNRDVFAAFINQP